MAGGVNANVARTCANLYKGGNRINSVCCDKSTEEVKCCLPDAIGSTRQQQSKKRMLVGQDSQGSRRGGGGKGGSARSRPHFPPPPLALLPQDASRNEEGGSVASRVSSLNSVFLAFFWRFFSLVSPLSFGISAISAFLALFPRRLLTVIWCPFGVFYRCLLVLFGGLFWRFLALFRRKTSRF